MKKVMASSQAGASIMELVIVLAILAILVTFSVAQFGGSNTVLTRQNIARDLKVSFERARFDSVKRRPNSVASMAKVTILNATSFSYTTDLNQNGTIEEPVETRTVDFSARNGVRLASNGIIFPITIRFDARGQITATNGASSVVTPLFYVCNGPCTSATATSQNSNIVYVSPTGTVAMMPGGQSVPTFSNPAVTAVGSNTSVNPLLSVWDDSADPVIPSPTATPAPTATPTPSPTPTPAPGPTPTPAPAAATCTYGQRPASTGCVCRAPMWVRTSGKCQ